MYGQKNRTKNNIERTCQNVIGNAIKEASRAATSSVNNFKKSDPILVRKKMEIKDVYYRKSEPKKELFRFELAFDAEQYAIVAVAICIIVMIWCCMAKAARKHTAKHAEKLAAKLTKKSARKSH